MRRRASQKARRSTLRTLGNAAAGIVSDTSGHDGHADSEVPQFIGRYLHGIRREDGEIRVPANGQRTEILLLEGRERRASAHAPQRRVDANSVRREPPAARGPIGASSRDQGRERRDRIARIGRVIVGPTRDHGTAGEEFADWEQPADAYRPQPFLGPPGGTRQ